MLSQINQLTDMDAQNGANEALTRERIALVNKLFKLIHGIYGSIFLAKYSSGQLDEHGADEGIINARYAWAYTLSDMSPASIRGAIDRMPKVHREYPPNAAQFYALCEIEERGRKAQNELEQAMKALPASGKAFSDGTRTSREAAFARIAKGQRRGSSAAVDSGLDALKTLIAQAVAAGGGDEVAELRRLDQMLAPRQRTVTCTL